MEKVIALVLTGIVWISQANIGFAEFRPTGVKESCYMRINAYCDESKTFVDGANWSLKNAGSDNHAIYVRHYVPKDEAQYSNLFRVRRVDGDGNTIESLGTGWCAPGLNIPIVSDEIEMGNYYSLSARGNTAHYTHENVNRIELRVNMYVNMKTIPSKKDLSKQSGKENEHGGGNQIKEEGN